MTSETPSPARAGDEPDERLREVLARGVEQALISCDQAERPAALAMRPDSPVDDEHLRFVTGFADIFVTIGALLFVAPVPILARPLVMESSGARPSATRLSPYCPGR